MSEYESYRQLLKLSSTITQESEFIYERYDQNTELDRDKFDKMI
jgi:hypothetical protein